jgi:hypothetical protein
MIPWVQSWSEGALALVAVLGVLVLTERRLSKLEAKVDLLVRFFRVESKENE